MGYHVITGVCLGIVIFFLLLLLLLGLLLKATGMPSSPTFPHGALDRAVGLEGFETGNQVPTKAVWGLVDVGDYLDLEVFDLAKYVGVVISKCDLDSGAWVEVAFGVAVVDLGVSDSVAWDSMTWDLVV